MATYTTAIRLALFILAMASCDVYSHVLEPYGIQPLEWKNDQISQVTTIGIPGQHIAVEGNDCIAGNLLNFNVRDEYAFDIDETVWLDLDLYVDPVGGQLSVSYDRSELAYMGSKQVQLPEATRGHWNKQSILLERARFANLGFDGSDFSISRSNDSDTTSPGFAICNLSLRRSYTTPMMKDFGWAAIEVVDEKGQPTPARMGIYDVSGRLPLPSDEALILRKSAGATRIIALNPFMPPWPVENRSVFYTDGRYRSQLTAAEYQLIIAKGPEYRLMRKRFTVAADKTKAIKVRLQRWVDMAAKGWYSGDDHIHYARESTYDDHNLHLFAQAEDLRVSNILHMGNITKTYFAHHDWKPLATDRDPFVLVPGQEDPRTSYRGHTIQLNIREPVRNPARYLLYHEVLENVRAKGGMTGYAHLTSGPHQTINTATGLAVDVPFGLVDFVEILSAHMTPDAIWFDFLNLGYKLSPTAGTDYMGAGALGYVRNYVQVGKQFTVQAWFDALKKGRTFVTNGPILEIRINGQGMGSEIHVQKGEPLLIEAEASINPDIGSLSLLELIEQGEAVQTVSSQTGELKMELRHGIAASHGTWFLLRARGENTGALALSAPIYISVDGQSFWKRREVPLIVAKLKRKMQELLRRPQLGQKSEWANEPWETRERIAEHWEDQHKALASRIDQANVIYDDLVKRAATSPDPP